MRRKTDEAIGQSATTARPVAVEAPEAIAPTTMPVPEQVPATTVTPREAPADPTFREMKRDELNAYAANHGVEDAERYATKADLIEAIFAKSIDED